MGLVLILLSTPIYLLDPPITKAVALQVALRVVLQGVVRAVWIRQQACPPVPVAVALEAGVRVLLKLIPPRACLLVAVLRVLPLQEGCPAAVPVCLAVVPVCLAAAEWLAGWLAGWLAALARYPEWVAAVRREVVPFLQHLCRTEFK